MEAYLGLGGRASLGQPDQGVSLTHDFGVTAIAGVTYAGLGSTVSDAATSVYSGAQASTSLTVSLKLGVVNLSLSGFGALRFKTSWVSNTIDQMTGDALGTSGQMNVLIDDTPDIVELDAVFGSGFEVSGGPSVKSSGVVVGHDQSFGARAVAGISRGGEKYLTDDGRAFDQYSGWVLGEDVAPRAEVDDQTVWTEDVIIPEPGDDSLLALGEQWVETGDAYSDYIYYTDRPRGGKKTNYDHGKISDFFVLQLLERDFGEVHQVFSVVDSFTDPSKPEDLEFFSPQNAAELAADSDLDYVNFGDVRDVVGETNGYRSDGELSPFGQFSKDQIRSKYFAGTEGNWQEFDWEEGFNALWGSGRVWEDGRFYGYGGCTSVRTGPRNVDTYCLSDSDKRKWLWERMEGKLQGFGAGLNGVNSAAWSEALVSIGEGVLRQIEANFVFALERPLVAPEEWAETVDVLNESARIWMHNLEEDMSLPLWLDTPGGAYTQAYETVGDRVDALENLLDSQFMPTSTVDFGNGTTLHDTVTVADAQTIITGIQNLFDAWVDNPDAPGLSAMDAADLLVSLDQAVAHIEGLIAAVDPNGASDPATALTDELRAFLVVESTADSIAAPSALLSDAVTSLEDGTVSVDEGSTLATQTAETATLYANHIEALLTLAMAERDSDLLGAVAHAVTLADGLSGALGEALNAYAIADANNALLATPQQIATAMQSNLPQLWAGVTALEQALAKADAYLGSDSPATLAQAVADLARFAHPDQTIGELPYKAIGEYSNVMTNHDDRFVAFENEYDDPVVVAFLATSFGENHAMATVSEVTSEGFQVRVEESLEHDGRHISEVINYLVMERGSWTLSDGRSVLVGEGETTAMSQEFEYENYGEDALADAALFAQVQNGDDFVFARARVAETGADAFNVSMESVEGRSTVDAMRATPGAAADIGWIAVESNDGSSSGGFKTGVEPDFIDHHERGLDFEKNATNEDFVWLARVNSRDETDPGLVRGVSQNTGAIRMELREDRFQDGETSHVSEDLAWIAFQHDGGLLYGF